MKSNQPFTVILHKISVTNFYQHKTLKVPNSTSDSQTFLSALKTQSKITQQQQLAHQQQITHLQQLTHHQHLAYQQQPTHQHQHTHQKQLTIVSRFPNETT